MTLSYLEKPEPKESNAHCSNPDNGAGEEEDNQKEEDDIVNREDLGGNYEYPIDRVEDIDVTKNVSAMALAD